MTEQMTAKLAQMIDRNSISTSLYDQPFCELDRSHKIGVAEELYRLGLTSQSRKLKDELGVAHGGRVRRAALSQVQS